MEYIDLGKICNIKTGKLDANASSENGNYPFFTCSKEPLKIDSYSYDCECILVAGNGDLNVKYYNGKFDAYQRTYIIEVIDKMKYSTKFLYLLINSKIDELRKAAIGGVIKYIKLGNLTNIKVPVLSTEEQQKIVEKMFSMDRVLEIKKNQLFKFEELIKSQFVEMFENKDFDTKVLEEFVSINKNSIKRGPFGGSLKKDDFIDSGYLVYEQRHAIHNDFEYEKYYITKEKYEEMDMFKVVPGDLIISCSGVTLGRIAEIPSCAKPGIINQALLKLTLNSKIMNNRFFMDQFKNKSIQDILFSFSRGSGIPNFPPMSEIKKIKFLCPPIELQNRYSQIVEQIDKQKFEFEKSLKKLEELQASLMQEYFG